MDEKLLIGGKIRELREEKDIKQIKMAKEIGCSAKMLSNYELNKRQPDLFTLRSICDYLNTTSDYLLGRTNGSKHFDLSSFSADEESLLEMYRKLPKPNKRDVLRYTKLNISDTQSTSAGG